MNIKDIETAITQLKKAQKLIENPENWVKRYFAVDSRNCSVRVNNKDACKFCSVGALRRVRGMDVCFLDALAFSFLADAMGNKQKTESIMNVNDKRSTKHIHIMMAFDFAILMAKDELKKAKKNVK